VNIDFDTSEVDRLAVTLGKAGFKATLEATKVIAKAAGKVSEGMKQDFTGHAYAPAIPRAINYDVRGLAFEVGVDKSGPQGGLGNILAFGTSRNAAVVDHTASLRRELPALEKYLADVAERAVE
jgi:hypothetical protein